jgi:hypothetical protein
VNQGTSASVSAPAPAITRPRRRICQRRATCSGVMSLTRASAVMAMTTIAMLEGM